MKSENPIANNFWNDNLPNHLPFLDLSVSSNKKRIESIDRVITTLKKHIEKRPERTIKEINKLEKSKTQETFSLKHSIYKVITIVNENLITEKDIDKLLISNNWREHLLAGICCLLYKDEDLKVLIKKIWKRIDLHSWVSPQLLVILSKIDRSFEKNCLIVFDKKINQYITDDIKNYSKVELVKLLGSLFYISKKLGFYETNISLAITNDIYNKIVNLKDYNGYKISMTWDDNYSRNWELIMNEVNK